MYLSRLHCSIPFPLNFGFIFLFMLENRSIRRFDYMTNEPTRKGQGDLRSAWFSESGGKGVSISALCPPFSPFKSFGSEKYQPLIPANHF